MGKTDAMNAEQMIDHVLGRLEGHDRARFEHGLHADPEGAARIERLRQAIHCLLDDDHDLAPPAGLARRTMALVAQSRTGPRSILDFVPARVPFRWADFAVAASIFIAGVLTLLPAIERSQQKMSQAGCVFNLQQLGSSLAQYASLSPYYPFPPSRASDAPVGTFAACLHDAGVLRDFSVLDCPFNGPCHHRTDDLPSFEQLEEIRHAEPDRLRHMLCWDYAYNVGHLDSFGSPRPLESRPAMAIPVVADAPSHENYVRILDGNSPNHARRGQNVLYSDGAVRWHVSRRVGPHDPDLYLNNQRQLEPSTDDDDAVLLPSYSPFHGLNVR
jgi:hypothetical protein